MHSQRGVLERFIKINTQHLATVGTILVEQSAREDGLYIYIYMRVCIEMLFNGS